VVKENQIFLDHCSTTPINTDVSSEMERTSAAYFANSSSTHALGQLAVARFNKAIAKIGQLMGGYSKREVVITSGATESNNTIIKGAYFSGMCQSFITTKVEHPSILEPLKFIEKFGAKVVYAKTDMFGKICVESLARLLEDHPKSLVTLCYGNSELGSLFDYPKLSKCTQKYSALLHLDISQSLGKTQLPFLGSGEVDFLSFSGHKIYGPKNVGAFVGKCNLLKQLTPLIHGGGQQMGIRAGTFGLPLVVGLECALEFVTENLTSHVRHYQKLSGKLQSLLIASDLRGLHFNSDVEFGLAHILNFSLKGADATSILYQFPHIFLSSSSACMGHKDGGESVLNGLGSPATISKGSFRVGLGVSSTANQLELFVNRLKEVSQNLQPEAASI
jgi:cysteine desulfurase